MRYSDRQTPAGIYTIYYKKSPDVLIGKQLANGKYEYEQPVTYWMPFNGGIGFHDANSVSYTHLPGWNILYFCLGGRSGDIMVCEMASQTEQRT